MKLIRKILIVLLLLLLQFSSSPALLVYAQEATSSTQETSQSEATSSAAEILDSLDNTESLTATPSALDITAVPSPSSAQIKVPPSVRSLVKKNYKAGEKLTVVIDNGRASDYQILLFSPDGRATPVKIEEVNNTSPAIFRITPPAQFKAGRHRLVVKDSTENVLSTQEFTWGVLAINTNKSIYLPNEEAKLAMAVLDETGLMVCDAKLELRIKNQESGIDDVLSTENGKITVNPECQLKEYVEKADYEATYQMGEAGGYGMTLTAETKNGTYTINDNFEVRDQVSFDIERVIATRLYPPVTYPAVFNISANEDFAGLVKEVVPASFAITQLEGVKAFDAIEDISEASASAQSLEASIFNLVPPFDMAYPITTRFGEELNDPILKLKYSNYGLLGHDGVDFDMEEGTPVLAVDDGVVVRARENWDYGTTIVIQHSWGKSYYGHLSLMTKKEGDKVQKGFPIGLSGSTGLSSGPHLHFGIKPNSNDPSNGYYGKIDPLPYLALKEGNQDVLGENSENPIIQLPASSNSTLRVISWNLSLKKGEKVQLGYNFQVPNLSPQFYLIGPLKFERSDGSLAFQEARQWQLAIDVDGSGTNSVTPNTGSTGATGQTYTFTFTATETMDSGGFTIQVPSSGSPDWSAPQGTGGTAGYTTAVGNSNATVARVISAADSTTGWAEDDNDACNSGSQLSADTTTKQEGTAAILCDNNTSAAPDGDDSFSFDFTAENWSSYSQIAAWFRSDDGRASGEVQFAYDADTSCWGSGGSAGVVQAFADFALTADTWTYIKRTLTATRTSIVAVCIGSGGDGFDNDSIWVDDVLVGPGVPTFSGSGPWTISARILDAVNTETFTVIYGDTAGGAGSEVTNSSTAGTHTFTTQSRISDAGALTNIANPQPTVELTTSGPTNDQLMRHGAWFNSSGVEQPFTF